MTLANSLYRNAGFCFNLRPCDDMWISVRHKHVITDCRLPIWNQMLVPQKVIFAMQSAALENYGISYTDSVVADCEIHIALHV